MKKSCIPLNKFDLRTDKKKAVTELQKKWVFYKAMFFLSSNATVKNVKINYEGMVTLISFSANNPLRSYKHRDYRSLNLHKLPIKNY